MATDATALAYEVRANNLSRTSENRIHDDEVARRFGFTGALVPGVEVHAYACHPVVALWGHCWLTRGAIETRFLKPVYDGAPVRATATPEATPDGEALDLLVESGGATCALGRAWLPEDAPEPIELADHPWNPPARERPPASEATLPPGRWLGTAPQRMTRQVLDDYLAGIAETEPLYAAEELVHPGLVLRLCNKLLVENVVLGPWIHVGSRVRHLSAAWAGETLAARGCITSNEDRKGHQIVELDALVVANDKRPVARVRHTAIWRPRGS